MKSIRILTVAFAALLLTLAVSYAKAQPLTIGSLVYATNGFETINGVVTPYSIYEVNLNTPSTVANPIAITSMEIIIKGSDEVTKTITTGPGCGQVGVTDPCQLLYEGGPSSVGFKLPPCMTYSTKTGFTQNCVSIALQLTLTDTSLSLLNGGTFCTYKINTTFLIPVLGQAAVNPQCNSQDFCQGQSVNIVLNPVSCN